MTGMTAETARSEARRSEAHLVPFLGAIPAAAPAGERKIPKIIWQFWHSGLHGAPEVVRRSHETWRHFNPDHEIRFLSLEQANAWLGFDFEALSEELTANIGWAGKSDLLRLLLLARYGGIWADATTFCLAPLDGWMHPAADGTGFFCFRHFPGVEDREMISWLIAASPGQPMIVDLLTGALDLLFRSRRQMLTLLMPKGVTRIFDLHEGDRPGLELLERCEQEQGRIPYYWMFYLFREVAQRHAQDWAQVCQMPNRRLQAMMPARQMPDALVSKQNRTDQYLASPNYRQRLAMLFDGDRVRAGYPGDLPVAAPVAAPVRVTAPEKAPAPAKPPARMKAPGQAAVKPWQQVRRSLQISEKRKVVFVHIPKCGGTSIDQSAIFEGDVRRWGHLPLQRYRRILGPRFPEFRVLTMVRNPWDRLVSAFHFASLKGATYKDINAADGQALMDEFGNDIDRFLPAFVAEPERFLRMLWFRPSLHFFDPKHCDVPWFVQKLEEIDDLEPLRRFVGMPDLDIGHHRKGPVKPGQRRAYTLALFDQVGQVYAEDIAVFGYGDTTPDSLNYC